MLTNILMVLIGMVICQLLVFILSLKDNLEGRSLCFCYGIPFILVAIPFIIIKSIRKSYIKSNYNAYRLYPKSLRRGLPSTLYMKPKTAQKFNFNEVNLCYIKLVSEGKDWKSLPRRKEMIKNTFTKNVQKYDLEKWLKSNN